MKNIEALKRLLDSPKKIVITTHIKPDADALGSSLGLAGFLKKSSHEVTVITPSDYPRFLNWMSGNDDVVVYSNENREQIKGIIDEADLTFCLDFSSLDRIEELGGIVRDSASKKILIDHHLEPENFADFMLWSIDSAATAELIYDFIAQLGQTDKIDSEIADCLYAGIMTDTGSFRHPSTDSKVFRTCAELIECGADVNKVAREVYDNNTISRLRLMGHAISARLTFLPELKTAYIALEQKDLNKYQSKTGDTEGLVNLALSVEGVELAALFSDKGDGIRMSFRSTGNISVNELARKYFNGGGHKNAAGGKYEGTLKEATEKFEGVVKEFLKENGD